MNKRVSGAPRRPRNPVAKAVRTPAFKQQVVPDKRWQQTLKQIDANEKAGVLQPESEEENHDETGNKD